MGTENNSNIYTIAFFCGYIVIGLLADLITGMIMGEVWDKTTISYKEVLKSNRKVTDKSVPFWLDSNSRKPFKWAPRTIGMLERFLYTTAIIFNQFALIGIWLVFKAIGDWSDFSSNNRKVDKDGTTRIRANNFLIGTGITLIFGIIGGILFRYVLNHNFLVDLIETSYVTSK